MGRSLLFLRHREAATPARVAAAASFLDGLLRAACPKMDPEGVTMVVSNLDLKAAIRPQTEAGRRAIRLVSQFVGASAPSRLRMQRAEEIAGALGCVHELILGADVRIGRTRTLRLDTEFVRDMKAFVRTAKAKPEFLGTMIVVSPVLRIGRTNEDKLVRARLRIGGDILEVPLAGDADPSQFFDAAKSGQDVSVTLEVPWKSAPDGSLMPDVKLCQAVAVAPDSVEPAMSGAELVAEASKFPSLFSDLDAILEDLDG